ncbi:hypothetical protein BVY02_01910 [bacterium J17]|nr:hypothetical protein BVY02_01910 [bacterium J17]
MLLVDSDEKNLLSRKNMLEEANYDVEIADNASQAIRLTNAKNFDFIISEVELDDQSGLAFLSTIRERACPSIVVLSSSKLDPATSLDAIQHGAIDCLLGEPSAEQVLLCLKKAKELQIASLSGPSKRSESAKRYSFDNIVAATPNMMEVFETIKKIVDYKTTVMLYGESGTGKELVARAIHYNSNRKNKRFVAINCGAIPENLLESELFGHKKGAFTDATKDKKGLFEEANGGTILLDEIGELPLHLQVKLLRVLQENEIRPVGGGRVVPINVRVLAATLRDLESDVVEGRFRDDLFYRLNVISMKIPALRERKDDIPILVNYFINRNREKLGLPVTGIEDSALKVLMAHHWPGNVRELENCVERAMILTDGDKINKSSLPRTVTKKKANDSSVEFSDDDLSIKSHTRSLEQKLIVKALEKTAGNRTHAAKLLEISHRTLLYKLKEYGLNEE